MKLGLKVLCSPTVITTLVILVGVVIVGCDEIEAPAACRTLATSYIELCADEIAPDSTSHEYTATLTSCAQLDGKYADSVQQMGECSEGASTCKEIQRCRLLHIAKYTKE